MDEIENAVAAGVHAGDYGGPSHGTLRRHRSGEAAERALLAEMVQVRERGEVGFHEDRVHAVHAEYDHPLAGGPCRMICASRSQEQCEGE